MNYMKKYTLYCLLIANTSCLFSADTTSKIMPRSQSFNAARQMIGWNNPVWGINRYPQDNSYSSFNLTFEYTHTFRSNRLTRSLFGDDAVCGACDDLGIVISGSAISNRNSTDWLADYFGLPRDFQSTVTFKPTISNFILDFSFYAGLDAWLDGLYFRIHGPFVHTRWSLNPCETICSESSDYAYGSGTYFQGYFSDQVESVNNMNTSFLAYANGTAPSLENTDWAPLCCSRINNDCACDALTRNGFADLRFALGYNFLNDEYERYHVGLGIYAAAPTGTSVGSDSCNGHGRYLFEPIVGNGKHWELGAQLTAHYIGWNNEDETKSLGVYVESNVTHLFGARQTRCFDLLLSGNNSRYMLAQKLESNRNTSPRLDSDTDIFGLEFTNAYAPVANITRRNVISTIAVQGDIAISIAYQSNGFQWDIGYNFWGRTCEDLCIDNCCAPSTGIWTLKGDQRVYGFEDSSNLKVALATSDSTATINQGSNMAQGVDYTSVNPTEPINAFADNAILAVTNNTVNVQTEPDSGIFLYTSSQPIIIAENNFNLNGTRGTSNKVFTNFNWAWINRDDRKWTPYVSLGGEVEFGGTSGSCGASTCEKSCATDCDSACTASPCNTTKTCNDLPRRSSTPRCVDCALSQWGVWLKVGSSYN